MRNLFVPALIFLLSLTLRLLYVYWAPQPPILFDAQTNYTTGLALSEHPSSIDTSLKQGPGYSAFLAGLFAFLPKSPWTVRYAQAMLSALTCLSIYSLGRRLAGAPAGLIAGLVTACYPPFILASGQILPETLASFLLWSGLAVLVPGLVPWRSVALILGGLSLGFACLTLPALLPTVPFLIAAAFVSSGWLTWPKRCLAVALFGLPVLGLLFVANCYSDSAGTAGRFEWFAKSEPSPTNARLRGWLPDAGPDKTAMAIQPADGESVLDKVYPAAARLNLVFCNLWFPANAWRQTSVLTPESLEWIHRTLLLIGLGGIGVAVLRWQIFAPILFGIAGLAIAQINWIDPRHNLCLMPALFILAAVCVVTLAGWTTQAWQAAQARYRVFFGVFAALALSGIFVWASDFFHLAAVMPGQHPLTLGQLGDFAVVCLGFALGTAVYKLAQPSVGRALAEIAGFLPSMLFAILFLSYAFVASEPRWRGWQIDLANLDGSVSHEIQLPATFPSGETELAVWLLDVQSDTGRPLLDVRMGEAALTGSQITLQRWFQESPDSAYASFASFGNRSTTTDRQWWCISFAPRLLEGQRTLRLTIGPSKPDAAGTLPAVRLGGVFAGPYNNGPYGPSFLRGGGHSVQRWLLTGDWRRWEEQQLSKSTIHDAIHFTATGEQREYGHKPGEIARYLNRGLASINIRLFVRMKNGAEFVF